MLVLVSQVQVLDLGWLNNSGTLECLDGMSCSGQGEQVLSYYTSVQIDVDENILACSLHYCLILTVDLGG